ncbi:MAG TPA: PAS domain S-box protein [Patescibacteria group bacterium]|nr:PAS domain S-box protein [Patescibacteria group bacterium]
MRKNRIHGMRKKVTMGKARYINFLKKQAAAAEEKYHMVVEHTRVIVFQTSITGQLTYLNPAWTAMTGFTEAEALGTSFADYIHPDERGCYQRYRAMVQEQQTTELRQEIRWVTKNIGFRWVEICQWALKDRHGAVVGSMGTLLDISARRITEDALMDSERRYRRYRQMFFENPAVCLVVDPGTGRITDVNAAAARFYGYSLEELKTMDIFAINMLAVDQVKACMDSVYHFCDKPFTFRHRLKSGEIRDVEVYSGPFESGEKILIFSMVIDITEKLRAEAELQTSRDRLSIVIEGTAAGLWEWDLINRNVYRDGRLQAIFGYENQDKCFPAEEWANYCHPDDFAFVQQRMEDCITGRAKTLNVEYRFRHQDGSYRWAWGSGKAVFDSAGRPVRFVGLTVDITAKKKVEELKKEHEMILRDFAQVVSDVSFIIDEDGRYIDVFGDPAEFLPLPCASLQGLTVYEVMPRGQADGLMAEIRLAMADKTIRCLDYTVDLAKGKRNMRRRAAPMSYTVNGRRTVAVAFQDVTDQERARRMLQNAYEMRRRSDFINDLINLVRPLDQQALAHCRNLGLDFSLPLFSCVIACSVGEETDETNKEQRAQDDIIDLLNNITGIVSWRYHGKIGVFCQTAEYSDAGKQGGLRLAGNIREHIRAAHHDLTVAVGVSRVFQGIDGLRKGACEAWEAVLAVQCGAIVGEGIFHYEDLGILQLLVEVGGRERADEFVQGMIGKLIDYDHEKGTDYLTTLEVMLKTSSLKETAQMLFLHHNTAVYRKRRIEKLLGRSINGFETKMAMAAAIKLYRLNSTK